MNLAKQYNLICNGNIILFILFLHHILYKPAFTVVLISSVFLSIWGRRLKKLELTICQGKEEASFWRINLIFVASLIIASCFSSSFKQSMYMALEYIYWWLPYLVMLVFLRQEDDFKSAYVGLALAGIFVSSYAIYQRYILDIVRPPGFYPNPNSLAACIELLLPALLLGWNYYAPKMKRLPQIFLALCIISTLWGLLVTESRGAILGLAIAFALYIMIFERSNKALIKKYLIFSVGILGIVFLVLPNLFYRMIGIDFDNLNADMGRRLVMQSSLAMWQDHKLWGIGLGNFQEAYETKYVLPEARERHLGTAHNTILQYLAESGIFSALLYIVMMGWHLYYMYKQAPDNLWCRIMFITILVLNIHSLADALYTVKPVNRMYWCLLGITVAFIRYKKAVVRQNAA